MNEMSALVRAWHEVDVPDGLRVELLDGELVMQANPGHLHDLPARSLVRHTPAPFEAWYECGLRIAEDYRPRADALPEPLGFSVRTTGWRPYR